MDHLYSTQLFLQIIGHNRPGINIGSSFDSKLAEAFYDNFTVGNIVDNPPPI